MGMVRGLENASAQLLAPTTITVEDRNGDPVEEETWEPVLMIQCRYEDASELAAGELAQYVENTPMTFIDASRIPDDLHEQTAELANDAEWPYLDETWRMNVMHQTYAVDRVHREALDLQQGVDYLACELEVL